MRLARSCTALGILLTAGFLSEGDAAADSWKVSRHDAARTGASSGSVVLLSPSVKWRSYVGGRPTDANARFGLEDPAIIVTSVGGRFVAKDVVTQAGLWSSPLLGTGTVVEMADLDGDGATEVVVHTSEQAHVLNGASGALIWSSPASSIQVMGAVRVKDLNGDGLKDVYLDNGVGAKPGTQQAAAYSFASGAAAMLWSLPIGTNSVNAGTDSILDVDDDGTPEVLLTSWSTIGIVRGDNGAAVATLQAPTAGNLFYQASAIAAQLDSTSTKEVVVVQPVAHALLEITPAISAFSLDPGTGQSSFLWSADTGSFDSEISANADSVSDLDGDGVDEVVFSFRSAATGDQWITQVLDGQTGSVLEELTDARFEGAGEIDGEYGNELVVATLSGVAVYSFAGGALSPLGTTLVGRRAFTLSDGALRASGDLQRRLATVPRSNGSNAFFVGTPEGSPSPQSSVSSFEDLSGFVFDGSSLDSVGDFSPLVGAVTGLLRADYATRPYPQIAVGTSEGVVTVLSTELDATNGATWLGLDPVGTFVGGGGIRPPLVAEDGAGPFVVFPGTAVGTVVADPTYASLIIPPLPRWWKRTLESPSIIEIDGASRVVGVEDGSLVARASATGSKAGEVSMPPGWIWGSPIPLQVNGQSGVVGVDWRIDGVQITQMAVDFSAESVLWTAAPIAFGGFFGSSAADIDADGDDDWFSMFTTLNRRNASSGAVTAVGDYPQLGYSLPLLAPFTGASMEVLLQSGGQGPKLLEADFSIAWETAPAEAVNGMAGTRTTCGGSARFVTPAVLSSYVRAYDGATGAILAERALAGGQAFVDVAGAVAAGHRPGVLGHLSSVADLAGQGPAVLVGSTDGHLYALDSCTLNVRWAADLGASVGEPVIADFDSDGDDEITVSAADGFVYGLDESCFPAPVVVCGDGGSGAWGVSAGEVVSLEWEPITGAAGYEVALVTPDDHPVWSPAYRSVVGTSVDVELEGALADRPYRVVVRATGAAGAGVEGFSRSIVVRDSSLPSGGLAVAGGATATLTASAADDLALDHYVMHVTPEGQGARLVKDGMFIGARDSVSVSFRPDEDLWGSKVLFSVDVLDSAGLRTVSAVVARITSDGLVVTSTDRPEGWNPPDEPGEGDTDRYSAGGGCSSAPGATFSWVLPLALAGLLVSRRRQPAGAKGDA